MVNIVNNRVSIRFLSRPENVALARVLVASLAAQLELTLNDLEEIKVAVSEAVSNAIIHGYQNDPSQEVLVTGTLYDDELVLEIIDEGVGIPDIAEALKPSFSTDPERMGLGFVFMQSFMDEVAVESAIHAGTKVRLMKRISRPNHTQAV